MPVFYRIEMDIISMPRSPFFARLADMRSPAGRPRENIDLIGRHRSAKSASPSGGVQIACRRLGKMTMGSMSAYPGHAIIMVLELKGL
jgi:hypothetical protein